MTVQVIADWELKEPASPRPTLVCEVVLETTGRDLILSVWRTAAPTAEVPEGMFRGLVEFRDSLDTIEHPDFSTWQAAVAWCTRTAQALDVIA